MSPPAIRIRSARHLRNLRPDHGSSIIEVAVVLPAFTMLLFAIFEFSMALTSYLGSTYAVRSAARYAVTHSSTSLNPASIAQLQTMIMAGPFVPRTATIAVTYYQYVGTASGNLPGNVIAITAQSTQNISLPFYSSSFTISTADWRLIGH